jgi:hypothetical protein
VVGVFSFVSCLFIGCFCFGLCFVLVWCVWCLYVGFGFGFVSLFGFLVLLWVWWYGCCCGGCVGGVLVWVGVCVVCVFGVGGEV